ncbi:MAG: hypothetical protein JWN15_3010, partial [Firmicutes bacterium]|nr:hypothetical protein [Bacillota bacterium]
DQMPRYGWNTLKCGGQPVPVEYHSVFGTGTGGRAAIGLRAQPQYTELMIQTEVMAGVAGATCEGPR